MKRLLAWDILSHLFFVGVGGMLGYGLYPLLQWSRSNVCRSDLLPLRTVCGAARDWRRREGKRGDRNAWCCSP